MCYNSTSSTTNQCVCGDVKMEVSGGFSVDLEEVDTDIVLVGRNPASNFKESKKINPFSCHKI